jgi:hypothetical protein
MLHWETSRLLGLWLKLSVGGRRPLAEIVCWWKKTFGLWPNIFPRFSLKKKNKREKQNSALPYSTKKQGI